MHHLMKKISTGTWKGMYVIYEVRPCNIFLYAYVYFVQGEFKTQFKCHREDSSTGDAWTGVFFQE